MPTVVLVSGTYDDALREKEALAEYLKDSAKLDLSKEKTRITPTEKGFEFLGHRIRMKWDDRYGYSPRIEIPKQKVLPDKATDDAENARMAARKDTPKDECSSSWLGSLLSVLHGGKVHPL
jgi:hypothetical protein